MTYEEMAGEPLTCLPELRMRARANKRATRHVACRATTEWEVLLRTCPGCQHWRLPAKQKLNGDWYLHQAAHHCWDQGQPALSFVGILHANKQSLGPSIGIKRNGSTFLLLRKEAHTSSLRDKMRAVVILLHGNEQRMVIASRVTLFIVQSEVRRDPITKRW